MFCCAKCFNDKFLQDHIAVKSNENGNCSFCGEKNVPVVTTELLQDLFEPLFDIYEENVKGEPLEKLLQKDWKIFAITDNQKQQSLLKNIIDYDSKLNYAAIYDRAKKNIEEWERFREELKHNNRFFPNNAPSIETIEPFGKYLGTIISKGSLSFYRARINHRNEPIDILQMGKPPKKETKNGRANPIGIPYLYIASSPETAITEIRGHKGETVTVAKFDLIEDLELVDLRDPMTTITPFGLDIDEIELIYKNLPFLELLGEELTKPIIPREANLEYLPSQYLSEIFKYIGFHGIIYKSSVSSGFNYVIFDDSKLQIIETYQYRIIDVNLISERID